MVNPEHLCLRIAMRTLIMWDSIEPSSSWLDSQLPRILAHIYKVRENSMPTFVLTTLHNVSNFTFAGFQEIAISRFGLPGCFPGTVSAHPSIEISSSSLTLFLVFNAKGSCFAVTGCCLGLGLRFAGTQNLQAMSLIEECLQIMMRQKSHLSQSDAHRGILEVLETCITSLIMSLSVVMAGSGDLRVFSLCRGALFFFCICIHTCCFYSIFYPLQHC